MVPDHAKGIGASTPEGVSHNVGEPFEARLQQGFEEIFRGGKTW